MKRIALTFLLVAALIGVVVWAQAPIPGPTMQPQPSGAAGGDLAGTYPSPTVNQITGNTNFAINSSGHGRFDELQAFGCQMNFYSTGFSCGNTGPIGFSQGAPTGAMVSAFSQDATNGIMDVGNGTQGDFTGGLKLTTLHIATGGSTTISTGVGSVKMSTANAATNTVWIPIKYAGTTYFVAGFTTNAP